MSTSFPVSVLAKVRPGMTAWDVLMLEYEMNGDYEVPVMEGDTSKDEEDNWVEPSVQWAYWGSKPERNWKTYRSHQYR